VTADVGNERCGTVSRIIVSDLLDLSTATLWLCVLGRGRTASASRIAASRAPIPIGLVPLVIDRWLGGGESCCEADPLGKQMSPREPPIVAFDSLSAPRELLDDDAVAP
jgi:hypothetical protein